MSKAALKYGRETWTLRAEDGKRLEEATLANEWSDFERWN